MRVNMICIISDVQLFLYFKLKNFIFTVLIRINNYGERCSLIWFKWLLCIEAVCSDSSDDANKKNYIFNIKQYCLSLYNLFSLFSTITHYKFWIN